MASHSTPLLKPAEHQSLSAGPDVYVLECHHVQSTGTGDDDAQPFRGMALLVSFSEVEAEADRLALWSLRHTLSFARCTVVSGADWPERLAERVAALKPEFVTATIFVGANAGVAAETVQSAVNALRWQFASVLAAVVVVSATVDSVASLVGLTGVVRGVHATNGDTARQVFLAMAALLANDAQNGIDIIDLLPVLGPACAPTLLAEALWFREGAGRLTFQSRADKDAAKNAARVVAVPFIRDFGWDEQRRFRRAIGAEVADSTEINCFATNNALVPGLLPTGVGWVPILCAPQPRTILVSHPRR